MNLPTLPNFARQTGLLFGLDMAANLVDYACHVYLGRALAPGDFAVFQSANSLLLILAAIFGVMQPALARLAAEFQAGGAGEGVPGLFRLAFGWSAGAGLLLGVGIAAARAPLGAWLNLPDAAIAAGAAAAFLICLRPVVSGMLQGGGHALRHGAVRLAFAAGRFALAARLLALGWGLTGALFSLPGGQLLAVAAGLLLLGGAVWRGGALPAGALRRGLRLTGAAFLAYSAHTLLLNLDLVWVNRTFPPEAAGAYAAAILFRRILLLLPGAAVFIMYPRVAAAAARRELPDRVIGQAALVVTLTAALVTGVYFAAGDGLVRLAFGAGYAAAGGWLGWMGVASLGFSLTAVWLNVFLATQPAGFTGVLAAGIVILTGGLWLWGRDVTGALAALAAAGWIPALGGGALYFARLRPRLVRQFHAR
jgi:O-antigen/teichoic acid export membrane protein